MCGAIVDQSLSGVERPVVVAVWSLDTGCGRRHGRNCGLAIRQFGVHRWGRRQRTIEGSLAMLVSLVIVFSLTSDNWSLWLPAVVIVTVLEAWTLQIDNLVLPLVGCLALLTPKR